MALKHCKPGQTRNPTTNRCKKVATSPKTAKNKKMTHSTSLLIKQPPLKMDILNYGYLLLNTASTQGTIANKSQAANLTKMYEYNGTMMSGVDICKLWLADAINTEFANVEKAYVKMTTGDDNTNRTLNLKKIRSNLNIKYMKYNPVLNKNEKALLKLYKEFDDIFLNDHGDDNINAANNITRYEAYKFYVKISGAILINAYTHLLNDNLENYKYRLMVRNIYQVISNELNSHNRSDWGSLFNGYLSTTQ